MKRLEPLLNRGVTTVTGKALSDNLADVRPTEDEVIRPMDRPIATKPAIVLVRGSLCPEAGIVKVGIDPNKIGVTGGSAGGHLSLMLAVKGAPGNPKAPDPVDRVSSAVNAVLCRKKRKTRSRITRRRGDCQA